MVRGGQVRPRDRERSGARLPAAGTGSFPARAEGFLVEEGLHRAPERAALLDFLAQPALPAARLLGEDVARARLVAADLARRRQLEALRRSPVGLLLLGCHALPRFFFCCVLTAPSSAPSAPSAAVPRSSWRRASCPGPRSGASGCRSSRHYPRRCRARRCRR